MVSSDKLLLALRRNGFKVVGKRQRYLVLRKGGTQLILPNDQDLDEKMVDTILSQAKLEPRILETARSSHSKTIKKEHLRVESSEPTREDQDMGFLHNAWEAESRIFSIGIYRVLIGVLFLVSALTKAPWNDFGWFGQAVQNGIDYPTFHFLGSFLQNTVQPNLAAFGWMVFVLESLIGVSLILGLFAVLSSFLGTFYVLLLWAIAGSWPTEWAWSYIMLTMSMIIFWRTKAGRALGADQTLVDKAEAYSEHSTLWALIGWMT